MLGTAGDLARQQPNIWKAYAGLGKGTDVVSIGPDGTLLDAMADHDVEAVLMKSARYSRA
jgi:hypothetical protein